MGSSSTSSSVGVKGRLLVASSLIPARDHDGLPFSFRSARQRQMSSPVLSSQPKLSSLVTGRGPRSGIIECWGLLILCRQFGQPHCADDAIANRRANPTRMCSFVTRPVWLHDSTLCRFTLPGSEFPVVAFAIWG